jgi:hypothetical protein
VIRFEAAAPCRSDSPMRCAYQACDRPPHRVVQPSLPVDGEAVTVECVEAEADPWRTDFNDASRMGGAQHCLEVRVEVLVILSRVGRRIHGTAIRHRDEDAAPALGFSHAAAPATRRPGGRRAQATLPQQTAPDLSQPAQRCRLGQGRAARLNRVLHCPQPAGALWTGSAAVVRCRACLRSTASRNCL